jgi:hypothetical protein
MHAGFCFLFFLQSYDNIGNLVKFSIKLEKSVANFFTREKNILTPNFLPKKNYKSWTGKKNHGTNGLTGKN